MSRSFSLFEVVKPGSTTALAREPAVVVADWLQDALSATKYVDDAERPPSWLDHIM